MVLERSWRCQAGVRQGLIDHDEYMGNPWKSRVVNTIQFTKARSYFYVDHGLKGDKAAIRYHLESYYNNEGKW